MPDICDITAVLTSFFVLGKGDNYDHYTEEEHQGWVDLNEYLSVIDLCGRFLRDGLINRSGMLSLLNTRWEDIKVNADLCEYFKEPGCPYENLIWMLKNRI